jgi:hypothetical protein
MLHRAAVFAAILALLAGCTLPWSKPEEPPVPGTHIMSLIHGFTAVIPEGWVTLESNPFSFPDPNPFPGQSDRQIFVRREPMAVLSLDVMLNPSDGRTVLPENADTAKVGELLAGILYSSRKALDSSPRIVMEGKDLRYDVTRNAHSGSTRFLGLVRPRSAGGYVVLAIVGDPLDATLDEELSTAREHLKVD